MTSNCVRKRLFVHGNEYHFFINDEKQVVYGKKVNEVLQLPFSNLVRDSECNGPEATVRCSPEDTWDRVIGVYVCLGKILEKENGRRSWPKTKEYINR